MNEPTHQANEKQGLIGPITFDLYVHVQSDDGTNRGKVTVGLPPGAVPTLEGLYKAIGQAMEALPDGYSLMGPDNFTSLLIEELTGERGKWAVGKGLNYDVAAVAAKAREALAALDVSEKNHGS
jgi:hypothetical protein